MTTARQHLVLYGRVRKALLSRYFALGRFFRNDFFQESTALEFFGEPDSDADKEKARHKTFAKLGRQDQTSTLWEKGPANRDNPWLFGSKLTIALATEARLGFKRTEPLLARTLRSCEQLFKFKGEFSGYPLRFDPVTSDSWLDDSPGGVSRNFLLKPDGKSYLFSTPQSDPRHFPCFIEDTGLRLMGRRRFLRHARDRNQYLENYRKWEPSQDEMVGVVTTYVALAEGTRDKSIAKIAKRRLDAIAEYLASHGYLGVRPQGGLVARGPGDALPALEWPFVNAIARVTENEPSAFTPMARYEDALADAGLWDLFKGPTDRAMAIAWATSVASPALTATLYSALAEWGIVSGQLKFISPGSIGFATGIYLARDGFDVWNWWDDGKQKVTDDAASGMALAALLHSWGAEHRFLNYVDLVAGTTGPRAPWSTGFLPYLGFISAGGTETTTPVSYQHWLQTRRQRKVDTDPIAGWSSSCFASAVSLLLSDRSNPAEEAILIRLLDARHTHLSDKKASDPFILDQRDVFAALDYVAALALAWRYRRAREDAGDALMPGFPTIPASDTIFPEPAVPKLVVDKLPGYVPVAAIQGKVPPTYAGREAHLFERNSPERPMVPNPLVTFTGDVLLHDETFKVRPGRELLTGIVLRWGDEWEITADGELDVDGSTVGPDGLEGPVNDARFPVHSGRDPNGMAHGLVAHLNNYVFIGAKRRKERWLYPEEALLYLRINQSQRAGTGAFNARVKVRGRRVALSRFLAVDCVAPDKRGGDRTIDGIGGLHRDGSRWFLPLAQALDAQKQGTVYFVKPANAPATEIIVRKRRTHLYLATEADTDLRNNLSWRGLARCSTP